MISPSLHWSLAATGDIAGLESMKNKESVTPICWDYAVRGAACHGQLESLQWLRQNKLTSPQAIDDSLKLAIEYERLAIIGYLLDDCGADPQVFDRLFWLPPSVQELLIKRRSAASAIIVNEACAEAIAENNSRLHRTAPLWRRLMVRPA